MTYLDEILSRHRQGRGKDLTRKQLVQKLFGRGLRMGISERHTTERNEKASKKVEGTLHDYGGAPGGTLL